MISQRSRTKLQVKSQAKSEKSGAYKILNSAINTALCRSSKGSFQQNRTVSLIKTMTLLQPMTLKGGSPNITMSQYNLTEFHKFLNN